ncbi:MAG: hypothetical protein ACLP9C_06480 [Acidimicrobiales bacterium]
MAGATYNGCTYEGGFQGMKPSGEARLIVTGDQFVLRRPRVFFSRSLYKLWAKWTAVTEVEVTAVDGGSQLKLTTKARGTGTIVIPEVTPDELWGVLDDLADLRERFHQDALAGAGTTEFGSVKTGTDKDDADKDDAAKDDAAKDDADKGGTDKVDSDKAGSQKSEAEETGAEKAGETSSEVQPDGEEGGEDVTGDAGDGEEPPAGDEPVGAGAGSLAGEDVSGDAGDQSEQADRGELPGATP